MRLNALILVFFLVFSLKPALSLSSFTFIKRLFSSSLLSTIRVVSSAHVTLLMFLLLNLIPACNSSSLACLLMCSAYRLNKQVRADSPVVVLSQSWTNQLFHTGSNHCFLTCVQVSQEAGKMVRYYHLFKSFPSEKAMATHSSTLAWKIPWMEEPGRLQSMVSLRVRHDWATSLSLFTFMHWRKKWQPTPFILAWRIPGTEEPSGLPPMGLHRVGQDWSDLTEAAAARASHGLSWSTQSKALE